MLVPKRFRSWDLDEWFFACEGSANLQPHPMRFERRLLVTVDCFRVLGSLAKTHPARIPSPSQCPACRIRSRQRSMVQCARVSAHWSIQSEHGNQSIKCIAVRIMSNFWHQRISVSRAPRPSMESARWLKFEVDLEAPPKWQNLEVPRGRHGEPWGQDSTAREIRTSKNILFDLRQCSCLFKNFLVANMIVKGLCSIFSSVPFRQVDNAVRSFA